MPDKAIKKINLPKELKSYSKRKGMVSTRSVGDVLQSVFPFGPLPKILEGNVYEDMDLSQKKWSIVPATIPDLFAATAYLLELCGAFSYYSALSYEPSGKQKVRLWLSKDEHQKAVQSGKEWGGYAVTDQPPAHIKETWNELIQYWDWPINTRAYISSGIYPEWWKSAYQLLIASDEAGLLAGFPFYAPKKETTKANFCNFFETRQAKLVKESSSGNGASIVKSLPPTMCTAADPDVVTVQPKALVSTVGGSTRVFSHNLALLKPRGIVRSVWGMPTDSAYIDEASAKLNILLVPIPYAISAKNFNPYKGNLARNGHSTNWRTFKVDQEWLKDNELVAHILKLVQNAEINDEQIDAVVIPELALDFDSYQQLANTLREYTRIDFLIAGVSQDCDKNHGNFVWCSRYRRADEVADGKVADNATINFVQSKHHRWKLDYSQINKYNISSLSSEYGWWEHLNVGGRELNFANFRSSSVFATLVCEDLARSEPCHEILKSVGPNLLFALLMDGPQISPRWSARYASYLADDPGTAVITLTSIGLDKLTNPNQTERCIAFVQDAKGQRKEINCKQQNGAVRLRLKPTPSKVESIDGREKNVVYWELDDESAIKHISPSKPNLLNIVSGFFTKKVK